jgi:hypothetical protein
MRRFALVLLVIGCGRSGFSSLDARNHASSVLRLDRFVPAVPLVDFPLLVVLDDTRLDRSVLAPDASNLGFFADDGTPLAHEVEQLGVAGGPPLLAWVRVPSIPDANATLTMIYGDGIGGAAAGSAWSDAYEAVWHMSGDPEVVLRDATAHRRDGTPTGTNAIAGRVGAARAFDASASEAIVVPASDLSRPEMTISAWLAPRSLVTGFAAGLSRQRGDAASNDFWFGTSNGAPRAGFYVQGATRVVSNPNPLELDRWTHVAGTWDGTTARIYVDGTLQGTTATAVMGVPASSPGPIYIGADRDSSPNGGPPDASFFDGGIDELRIENIARDTAWFAAEIASATDQVISYGAIER